MEVDQTVFVRFRTCSGYNGFEDGASFPIVSFIGQHLPKSIGRLDDIATSFFVLAEKLVVPLIVQTLDKVLNSCMDFWMIDSRVRPLLELVL